MVELTDDSDDGLRSHAAYGPRDGTTTDSPRVQVKVDEALALAARVRLIEALFEAHTNLVQHVTRCHVVREIMDEASDDRAMFANRAFRKRFRDAWKDLRPIGDDMARVVTTYVELDERVQAYDRNLSTGTDRIRPLGNPTQDPELVVMTDGMFEAFDEMEDIVGWLVDRCAGLVRVEARAAADAMVEIERIARRLQGSTAVTASMPTNRTRGTEGAQAQSIAPTVDKLSESAGRLSAPSSATPASEGGTQQWSGTPRQSSPSMDPMTN